MWVSEVDMIWWNDMETVQVTLLRWTLASSLESDCTSCHQQLGHVGSRALLQQNPPVVSWGCWLAQGCRVECCWWSSCDDISQWVVVCDCYSEQRACPGELLRWLVSWSACSRSSCRAFVILDVFIHIAALELTEDIMDSMFCVLQSGTVSCVDIVSWLSGVGSVRCCILWAALCHVVTLCRGCQVSVQSDATSCVQRRRRRHPHQVSSEQWTHCVVTWPRLSVGG